MGMIKCEQVLEAYNTFRNYCREQEICEDCLLSISGVTSQECFLMHVSEPPEDWEAIELE